ncbi:MAG: CARDB domain-containing protein, partial [Candidatus Promineifilaceae bacterium]
ITPSVFDTATDTTTVTTQQQAGVSLVPDNVASGMPGETVVYTHTLTNLGNGQDTFNMAVNSSQGWNVSVIPTSINIVAGQKVEIMVSVDIPTSAVSGTVDVATVTAISSFDTGVSDSAQETTTVTGEPPEESPTLYLPIIFKPGSGPPPPTPTPTATPTTSPCVLNVPPSGNPPGVDLVITNITLVPSTPQAGQQTSVRVTIKNQGQTDVAFGNNFYLDFYDNPNPEPPQHLQFGNIAWGVQGSDMEAGASMTFIGNHVFTAGFHRLWAQADTDNTVVEANENNNLYGCKGVNVSSGQSAPRATSQPQPTAESPRATPTPGQFPEIKAAEPPKPLATPVP